MHVSSTLKTLFIRRPAKEQPNSLILLGILCIAIYALTRTGFSEVASSSSAVAVLLGFWGLYKYGKDVNSHTIFRFLWIAILFQCISWGLSQYLTPEWAENHPKPDRIARWLVFIPLAWWIAQYKNAIWLLWGCAGLGILVSPWVTGEGIPEIIRGINGERVYFGLRQVQHTSLFFGAILIGLLCFRRNILQVSKWLFIPFLCIIAYCLLIIYINSSRQAWLALLLTAFFMGSLFTMKKFKQSNNRTKLITLALFVAAFLTLSTVILKSETIVNRVMQEKEALQAIATLNFDNVPYSSFGIRLHSWVAAIDFIKEKPIFGWGGNGRGLVMDHTEWLPDDIRRDFGHLHNTYLELLVNYGTVGFIFYISLWVYMYKNLFKQIKSNKVEPEIGYFFVAFLCFWTVMNCFEAYMNFWTGVFYFTIFMTGIQSRIWRSNNSFKTNN